MNKSPSVSTRKEQRKTLSFIRNPLFPMNVSRTPSEMKPYASQRDAPVKKKRRNS